MKFATGLAALPLFVYQGVFAQGGVLAYPGCNVTYSDNNFKVETLVRRQASGGGVGGVIDNSGGKGLWEPTKLAVGADASGNVEVYFTELGGSFKVYWAKDKSVHRIAKLDVDTVWSTGDEMGLMGVALAPDFKTSRQVYLYNSPRSTGYWRLSRYTLSEDRLSVGPETIIFQWIVQKKACCHTGGGMHFDDLGDLWLSIGNNEGRGSDGIDEGDSVNSAEWGSSSTASPRGGVIRIHPLQTAGTDGKLYSIPKGNFGEYWGAEFEKAGKTALAAQYRDPKKVLPEIYVKGNRNPYGIAVDRVRRWLWVGDVGPDGDDRPMSPGGMGEDHDFYMHPGFSGWPYYTGINYLNSPNAQKLGMTAQAPTNKSKWNKGVQELPPTTPSLWAEHNGASFAGFFYRYDMSNTNPQRLPAIFHKHTIWASWGGNPIVTKHNDDGAMIGTTPKNVMTSVSMSGETDIQLGPDGAVYVAQYAGFFDANQDTRIDRIYYTGQQCAVDVPQEKAGCKANDPSVTLNVPEACGSVGIQKGYVARGENKWMKKSVALGGMNGLLEIPEGIRSVEIYSLQGRKVFGFDNAARVASLKLPPELTQGVYHVMMSR